MVTANKSIGAQIPIDIFRITRCTNKANPWKNRSLVAQFFDRASAYEYHSTHSLKNFKGDPLQQNILDGLSVERSRYVISEGKWYKLALLATSLVNEADPFIKDRQDKSIHSAACAVWDRLNLGKDRENDPAYSGTVIKSKYHRPPIGEDSDLPSVHDQLVQLVYSVLAASAPAAPEDAEGPAAATAIVVAQKIVKALQPTRKASNQVKREHNPAAAAASAQPPRTNATTTNAGYELVQAVLRNSSEAAKALREEATKVATTLKGGHRVTSNSRVYLEIIAECLDTRGVVIHWVTNDSTPLSATAVNLILIPLPQ